MTTVYRLNNFLLGGSSFFRCIGDILIETRPTLKEDATITKFMYAAHLLQHLKGD